MLKSPPSSGTLKEWTRILSLSAADLLRPRSPGVKALGDLAQHNENDLLTLMASDGDTIRRPIIIAKNRGMVGASEEALHSFAQTLLA